MSDPPRPQARYQPYYCEENVWLLAGEPALEAAERAVLVVSNRERAVALWGQRAGKPPGGLVVWDYHVVLLARPPGAPWLACDLDTRLGFPVPLETWLTETFRPLEARFADLAPRFRLVPGEDYRAQFASDRSHMRRSDGSWQKPPPPWPAIGRAGAPSFLRWTEMREGDDSLTLDALLRWGRP